MELVLKRFLALLPMGLGIVVFVALLIHIIPGDPVDMIAGELASPTEKDRLRVLLGLDRSWWEQVFLYLKNVIHGDLGVSFLSQKPVSTLIGERLWPTLSLAFWAMFWAICFSIPMGVWSALRENSPWDKSFMVIAILALAVPNVCLGPMLLWIFGVYFGWLPVADLDSWSSFVLPSLTLGISLMAILSRVTRASMIQTWQEDFIRLARAKGQKEWKILLFHALPYSALPLISLMSLQLGVLLTGAIITEKIFDWPGLGTLMIEALNNRDYPLVQGCVLYYALSYVVMSTVADLFQVYLDPRIQWRDRRSR